MKRSTAAAVVVVVAAAPRLLVLARERETILEEFVDKSDRFATTLVDHGTFGFLPGVPSAYTQPLYGWFLAAIYLPFGRSWLAVGLAQIAVAVATALVVFAIGTRLRSPGVGLVAATIATLHPYVVWHDVHLNREVLDGLALALLALCALAAYERQSLPLAAATGAVAGLAILGNARLLLLPIGIAVYVAWRTPVEPWADRGRTRHRDGRGGSRTVGRAEQGAGRLLRDHDGLARPLEGEQREHARASSTAAAGSTTSRSFPERHPGRNSPRTSRSRASRPRSTSARRCACTATRSSTSGASTRARRACSRSKRRACSGTRCRRSRTRAEAARPVPPGKPWSPRS